MSDPTKTVKERIDLVELVASYGELRRQGSSFVTQCPWHEDRKPSLTINPSRQLWKCWVCDIQGDCYDWVMRRDGLSFRDALQKLADRAGVTLSSAGRESPSRAVFEILEAVASLYQKNVDDPTIRDYLKVREISGESISKWRIGYATTAFDYVTKHVNATEQQLIESGVCAKTDAGKLYDRFRGRLIFPITNYHGKVVSFGARLVPGVKILSKAKYLNGPETFVFRKSETLYGLHQASAGIKKEGISIVTEGYTDVIQLHQHGYQNAVACLGVALGEAHIRRLRQITDGIAVLLDGDAAGQKSADRVLPLLAGLSGARVAEIPGGLDPADFVVANGNLRSLIQSAPDPIAYRAQKAFAGFDPRKDSGRTKEAIAKVMEIAQGALTAEVAMGLCARMAKVPLSAVRAQVGSGRGATQEAAPIDGSSRLPEIESGILRLLVKGMTMHVIERVDPEFLNERAAKVLRFISDLEMQGVDVSSIDQVLQHTDDVEIRSALSEAVTWVNNSLSDKVRPEMHLAEIERKLEIRRERSVVSPHAGAS